MEVNINGLNWEIIFVEPYSPVLFMHNNFTLGVTDLMYKIVYISNDLDRNTLYNVLFHELTHCWLYSYGYRIDIPCEELICQIVERNSDDIQYITNSIYEKL